MKKNILFWFKEALEYFASMKSEKKNETLSFCLCDVLPSGPQQNILEMFIALLSLREKEKAL